MKKLFIPFLLVALCTFSAIAAHIDAQMAQKLAQNFYLEKSLTMGKDVKMATQLKLVYTQFAENEAMYYAFSAPKGFIIIAADDDVIPVLAYSFEGGFNAEIVSPEFKWWMGGCEQQILYAKKNALHATNEISTLWSSYTASDFTPNMEKSSSKSTEPLLMSTWDQGRYYNYLCPEDPAGQDGHVWTGCVATAMAQVMYYYRYPDHGTGSHGYNSDYGYLSADFSGSTYNWDYMQNDASGKYNFDMAQLQSHLGIAIDMMYSPDGSGAYMDDDANAMKNNFGYSSTTQLFYKESYTAINWANLLKTNLDNKMPIQYAGYGPEGGHAFVCDGYQSSNYFHFNWGWSGSYNGYFYVDNLNPGYTFNDGQQAILNSYPASNFPQSCGAQKTLTSAYGTIEDGSSPKYNYLNNLDCSWLIAPTDVIDNIKITFNRFETEADHDIVTIYDGETINAPVLGVYSGNSLPAEITSTGTKVLVRFTTDGANVANGWLLTYTAKPTTFCTSMQELTTPNGTISDGSDTNKYNNNSFCHWRITLPVVSTVSINFNSFSMANDEDFVKIYDETANTEVASYTAATPPQSLVVYTDKVLILFKTNGLNTDAGWDLTYSSMPLSVVENQHASVSVYPNPTSDFIKIEANVNHDDIITVEVMNALGEKLIAIPVYPVGGLLNKTIDLKGLAQGIYFLKLSSDSFNHTQKILVR